MEGGKVKVSGDGDLHEPGSSLLVSGETVLDDTITERERRRMKKANLHREALPQRLVEFHFEVELCLEARPRNA